jgi:hypothetical protein
MKATPPHSAASYWIQKHFAVISTAERPLGSPSIVESIFMVLSYTVRYGSDLGLQLAPHRYRDKKFRMRKKAGDAWIAVEESQIESYLSKGYILRMSARGHSPSGISPNSIEGWKQKS